MEPGPVFPTLSDGPSNTYTWWAGPLYKRVGPKENQTNGVFMVHLYGGPEVQIHPLYGYIRSLHDH